jgi:hypothetical protein
MGLDVWRSITNINFRSSLSITLSTIMLVGTIVPHMQLGEFGHVLLILELRKWVPLLLRPPHVTMTWYFPNKRYLEEYWLPRCNAVQPSSSSPTFQKTYCLHLRGKMVRRASIQRFACRLLLALYALGFLFEREDGSSMFLRNVCQFRLVYTAVYHKR